MSSKSLVPSKFSGRPDYDNKDVIQVLLGEKFRNVYYAIDLILCINFQEVEQFARRIHLDRHMPQLGMI